MAHTHTHTRRQNCHKPFNKDDLYRVPNKHFPTQMGLDVRYTSEPAGKTPQRPSVFTKGPQWQTHIRTNWQNTQIALCTQKKVSWVHTNGLTGSWSSSACPEVSFCSIKEKHSWESVPSRRETGRIPKTNGIGSC